MKKQIEFPVALLHSAYIQNSAIHKLLINPKEFIVITHVT